MNEIKEQAIKLLKIEAEAVHALIERIDDVFISIIDILFLCKGKIVLTGMGKSGLIGKKMAATLASTGTPAFYFNAAEGSHGDLGVISKSDVVIALSYSGETEELIRLLPALKRMDIQIIALTGNPGSTLGRTSDITLDVSVKEEACPMGLAPTASTTALLAMGDAIAITLLKKRGFSEEDFACVHPGGSLGKKLLLTVEDLMHTGNNIPSVSEEIVMKEAIIEISSKRLGMTAVTDSSLKLKGIITDGDLRRGLEKWGEEFFSLRADDVMTHRPRTIRKNILAAKAVAIMEKYAITCLMVTDDKDTVEGIIHLHDLLRAGIA